MRAPRHCGKQPVVIYPVEKFGQVNVYHKPVAVDDVRATAANAFLMTWKVPALGAYRRVVLRPAG
jgi:hypothetical protein